MQQAHTEHNTTNLDTFEGAQTNFKTDEITSDTRPFLIFVNPNSGPGESLKVFKKYVSKCFLAHKIDYKVFITKSDMRVKDYIALKATEELVRYRAYIVVSGDGLVFELVNTLMNRTDRQEVMSVPIGIIPTGSGNGLAHTLIGQSQARIKNRREAVKVCCKQATRGQTCTSDLVRISYDNEKEIIWSFLSIGWGLLSDIDVDSDWMRRLGDLRFTIYGLMRTFTSVSRKGRLSYKPALETNCDQNLQPEINSSETMHATGTKDLSCISSQDKFTHGQPQLVTSDEHGWIHIEDKFACLYAVHQSHISMSTKYAPKSRLSDGIIYLSYIRGKLNPCQAFRYLLSIDDASHERLPYVKVIPVKEFKFQPLEPGKIVVDGEIIGWNLAHGPISAKVVPNSMKLLWAADDN